MHAPAPSQRPAEPGCGAGRPSGADAPASDARIPAHPAARPLDSQALLGGGKAVEIHHNGAIYRLQATRQGKLILTK
ncbi:MAG: hemin uptake protein HemP [Burkholderiaceae bacterium]|nr:hemin uptake protein HemP [Burkholderiaceae bacterium]